MKYVSQIIIVMAICTTSLSASAQWKYSNFPDPNTAETLRLASVESSNWNGTLLVRMLPDANVSVAFGVPATIVCQNPCQVTARLDGGKRIKSDARYPGSQKNMLFFSPNTLSFATIHKASKLEVEVETKEFGWRVLVFDVRGFNVDRLNAGR